MANVVVMICTRIDKRLKTVSSLYVYSLAIVDTIVGFAVMGPMTVSNSVFIFYETLSKWIFFLEIPNLLGQVFHSQIK